MRVLTKRKLETHRIAGGYGGKKSVQKKKSYPPVVGGKTTLTSYLGTLNGSSKPSGDDLMRNIALKRGFCYYLMDPQKAELCVLDGS